MQQLELVDVNSDRSKFQPFKASGSLNLLLKSNFSGSSPPNHSSGDSSVA